MREHIQYDFLQDGHFAELKKAELLENRLNSLQTIEPYIGTFFSKEYVLKNVLSMTDAEIDEMQRQISKEAGMPPEEGGVVLKVSLQAAGKIQGDEHTSIWTH